jgi:hypothetical protein
VVGFPMIVLCLTSILSTSPSPANICWTFSWGNCLLTYLFMCYLTNNTEHVLCPSSVSGL